MSNLSPTETPVRALGLDLGGTKIAARTFGTDWTVLEERQAATPQDYDGLVATLTELASWAGEVPVGVASAGLLDPATGLIETANLCASGRALPGDLEQALGRPVTWLNDARALALSEAVLGAGHDCPGTVFGLVLGTGVGGGLVREGRLVGGLSGAGGEVGHISAPAALVAEHGLPILRCGCGRLGCIETLISGPGLSQLALVRTGAAPLPEMVTARRHDEMAEVWGLWCALVADLIRTLTLTCDPDLVVLGGGLSAVDGVARDLSDACAVAGLGPMPLPPLAIAEGGPASGARGAALAAVRAGLA